jgi:hypothetical protein
MMQGTPYGADRARHYWSQTNNSAEYTIRAIKAEIAAKLLAAGVSQAIVDLACKGYLESCGMDAMIDCAMSLVADPPDIKTPAGTVLDLDDVAMMIASSPKHAFLMRAAVPGLNTDLTMENRIMQLHPVVCSLMFKDVVGQYVSSALSYDDVVAKVLSGLPVEIHLPGHYVPAVLVEKDDGTLRINDSWGGRKPEWKGDGFCRLLDRAEFATAKPEFVIYGYVPKE